MGCIDSVDNYKGEEGQQQQHRCDDLLRSLDDCLKVHQGYYDKIDVYGEEEEQSWGGDYDSGDSDGNGYGLISAWWDLISTLKQRRRNHDGSSTDVDSRKDDNHDDVDIDIVCRVRRLNYFGVTDSMD